MRLLLTGILFLWICCITACKVQEPNSPKTEEAVIENKYTTPQILTLIFEINSEDLIQMSSPMLNNGRLRKDNYTEEHIRKDDLSISFLDEGKNICSAITIANPLKKQVEYSDDYRNMKSKIIDLEKAPFSIRVQREKCMKYIRIEKIIDNSNKNNKLLFEVPLTLEMYE